MLTQIIDYFRLAAAYTVLNFKAQLEYRSAFISQVFAMFVNDAVWVAFWSIFFLRFPVIRGWNVNDVITLWAITAAGFGLAHSICGNALDLPRIIVKGQLDAWMLYPRALLPHLLVGRMSTSAIGDALFGYVVYVLFVHPDISHFLLFSLLTVSVAILFVGFSVASGSLGFFIGNAEGLSQEWRFSLITFSTYPSSLFDGAVKVLLYTLIPAGFISYFSVAALRNLSFMHALAATAGSIAVLIVGILVFYCGLKRYESGNLMEMRG